MRFGTHTQQRGSILHSFTIRLATLAGAVAIVLGGVFAVIGQGHIANASPQDATAGLISPVTSVAASSASRAMPSQASEKGTRFVHPASARVQAVANGPSADGSSFNEHESGAVLNNFNGVSSLDSAVTNFGAEFEPPDQGLCVGNGFVVEPVNSAYTIYRSNGAVVAGPFNVNALFDEGLTEFTSDPRCYFDQSTHTWFAIILFISDGGVGASARTDIAVNTSGDPTTPWTVYHLDATDDGTNHTPSHSGCPCFGDQPRLGLDQDNLYISTDEFSILGPEFNGTQIYAVSKSDLIHHAAKTHFVHFDNLSIGGAIAGGVAPAITTGPSDAEYFLNSLDPTGTTDNRLGVWALTNRQRVSQGGLPTLSRTVITSEMYGVPPAAIQKGSSSTLDAGDDRMQQVEFMGGSLWGALDTVLTPHGDTTPRAAAAWFKVHPQLSGNKLGSAQIQAQGYVASVGNYLLYPAIQPNQDGTAGMVMTLSGSKHFPSAVYTILHNVHLGFGPIHIAAAGTGSYDPAATRWGDYSWAALAPDQHSFWFATEYIPAKTSQTPDRLRNWGTRVFQISAGEV